MLNVQLTLTEAFSEAKERIDGVTMIISVIISIFLPVFLFFLKIIRSEEMQFNWPGLIVPLLVFISYARFRQSDPDERKFRQIINSVLLLLVSFSLIYVINFK